MLKRTVERFPGYKGFLEKFFETCRGFSPEVNYLGFVEELRVNSSKNREVRKNAQELVRAFYEITGTTERELEERVERIYELGER